MLEGKGSPFFLLLLVSTDLFLSQWPNIPAQSIMALVQAVRLPIVCPMRAVINNNHLIE